MINRLFKIIGWSLLWLLFFWAFLVAGFPNEAVRGWLAERIGKGTNAAVSIEDLRIKWNLEVKIMGISIESKQEKTEEAGNTTQGGFSVKLNTLSVEPRLLSLIRRKPALKFNADTPSGGNISGSYDPAELSVFFKDLSFKDINISSLPVPSGTTASGSGKFKLVAGKGSIDVEVDGVPGGKQNIKVQGGASPGLDGKLKAAVTLPKL